MADTRTRFCGIDFKNPVVVASIEPTNSPDLIRQCFDAGASGAILKTLTDIEDMARLTENSKYCVMDNKGGIIRGKVPRDFLFYSRSGYSSTHYKEWAPHMAELQKYAAERDAHLIGSVGAKDIDGWRDISRTIEDCGIPLVELNFGCPHPAMMPGVHGGSMIGQEGDVAAEVTRVVTEALDIPVMIKLTPDQSRPLEIARKVRDAGAAAVTATNRYTGYAIDIETGRPRIGGPAGIGGPWTKALSLRWVHRITQELGVPVSGSNGIFDHRDVVEFIMAGAGIVQVGSVLMIKGIKWLPKIIQGVERFLDDHGHGSVDAIRSIAAGETAKDYSEQFAKHRVTVEVDGKACKNPSCTVCIQMCFYEALSQGDGKIDVHPDSCIGCELCLDVCPFDAIAMRPIPEDAGGYFRIPEGAFETEKFTTRRNNPESIVGVAAHSAKRGETVS